MNEQEPMGGAENAGLENAGPKKCRTGK